MKKEINIPIKDKIINKDDILRLSKIFWTVYSKNKSTHARLSFTFACDELDSTYEFENKKLETEEEFLDTKKIKSLSMSFHDYTNSKHIQLNLSHGNTTWNKLKIEGSDNKWVDAKYNDFKDKIEAIKPQVNWFLKYKKIIYHISSLNVGFLFIKLLWLIPTKKIPYEELSPFWQYVRDSTIIRYATLTVIAWGWGASVLWWVFEKISELWPSVEFDFGPEHFKQEKKTRKTIGIILSLIIIPLILQLLFWIFTK